MERVQALADILHSVLSMLS